MSVCPRGNSLSEGDMDVCKVEVGMVCRIANASYPVLFLKKYWRDPSGLAEQPLVWQRQLWVPASSPGAMSEQAGVRPGQAGCGQAGRRWRHGHVKCD